MVKKIQESAASLLDDLARQVGCTCLSDLRSVFCREQIAGVLPTLPAGKYPLAQWNETAAYIFKGTGKFVSETDARAFLAKKLKD